MQSVAYQQHQDDDDDNNDKKRNASHATAHSAIIWSKFKAIGSLLLAHWVFTALALLVCGLEMGLAAERAHLCGLMLALVLALSLLVRSVLLVLWITHIQPAGSCHRARAMRLWRFAEFLLLALVVLFIVVRVASPDPTWHQLPPLAECEQRENCAFATPTTSYRIDGETAPIFEDIRLVQARLLVSRWIEKQPRSYVLWSGRLDDYRWMVHVRLVSAFFGFADDLVVELREDYSSKDAFSVAVTALAQARLGKSDFNVNPNRLKQLLDDLAQAYDNQHV